MVCSCCLLSHSWIIFLKLVWTAVDGLFFIVLLFILLILWSLNLVYPKLINSFTHNTFTGVDGTTKNIGFDPSTEGSGEGVIWIHQGDGLKWRPWYLSVILLGGCRFGRVQPCFQGLRAWIEIFHVFLRTASRMGPKPMLHYVCTSTGAVRDKMAVVAWILKLNRMEYSDCMDCSASSDTLYFCFVFRAYARWEGSFEVRTSLVVVGVSLSA